MDLDKGSFSSITGRLKLNPLETLNFLFLLCKMSMKSWPISTMHFNLCWNCTRSTERWGFCTPVMPWISSHPWFFSPRKLFETAACSHKKERKEKVKPHFHIDGRSGEVTWRAGVLSGFTYQLNHVVANKWRKREDQRASRDAMLR